MSWRTRLDEQVCWGGVFRVPLKRSGSSRNQRHRGTAQGDNWNCPEAITPSRNEMP